MANKNKTKDDIIEDDDFISQKRKKQVLSELDELDMEPASMISMNRPKQEKKKNHSISVVDENDTSADDEWLSTISSFKTEPIKRSKRKKTSIFDYYEEGNKKKKKKKKKNGELTDYNKEFENEVNLIKNLLVDQNHFVSDLQKKYDATVATKSSQRGIGKFTTDLMMSINNGRSLSMNLVDKLVSIKKTIADLSMKEKKELSAKLGDGEDMANFSAQFLKQMLNEGREAYLNADNSIEEYNEDDLFSAISDEISDMENEDEIDKYLKYEQQDVTVFAIEDSRTGDIYYEARNSNGDVIDDYPLPKVEGVNINRSTNVATDKYSRKYPVEYI